MAKYTNPLSGSYEDWARSGNAYHVAAYFTLTSPGTSYFQLKTPESTEVVIVNYNLISGTQPVRFKAIENPTVTDGTVAVTALNLNRQSANTADLVLYNNPTSISSGTTLVDWIVPSGENKTGGVITGLDVWTLKASEDYVVSVENLGNNTTSVTFAMTWLEI